LRSSVIPLAALMQIDNPQTTAKKMVEIVNQIEDEEEKRLLWASTIALMSECSHSAFECERLVRSV